MQNTTHPLIPAKSRRSLIFLAIAFFIVFTVSFAGSVVTRPAILGWYADLVKPSFNPPNWIFPVVWPILFTLMMIGFWRILRQVDAGKPRGHAIFAFLIQLVFNLGWSVAFFGAKSLFAGLVVAVGLILTVAAMVITFRKIDPLAAWLQLPYLAWVTFAMVLTAAIWRLN
jgi:translocator protein